MYELIIVSFEAFEARFTIILPTELVLFCYHFIVELETIFFVEFVLLYCFFYHWTHKLFLTLEIVDKLLFLYLRMCIVSILLHH